MTAVWQAGHTYPPGSIVRPTTVAPSALPPIGNGSFETGDLTNWTLDAGAIAVVGGGFSGGYMAKLTGNGLGALTNHTLGLIQPGATVSAQVMISFNNAGVDDKSSRLFLNWYDASSTYLGQTAGDVLLGKGGVWKPVTVTAAAPAGATKVAVHLEANNGTHGGNIDIDNFTWSSSNAGPPSGLVYKATQAAPGKSGANEPAWPNNTTTPVTDNQVTWQGIIGSQLVWTATPINQSGGTEPTWPTQPGGAVNDNGIQWIAKSPAIADPNCPHSKIVAIAASKIYAADGDIIRYCATVNPLDWSTKNDAGYLPFGLQTYGSNPVEAMNLYRSNLVAFNSEGFQMWQVDEDPANSALLDALPVASTHNLAASPVSNDLLFLSAEGVRSMGIAAASTNLQGGDVGMPMDPLIKQSMKDADAAGAPIIATYIPSLGQYWLAFSYVYVPLVLSGTLANGSVGTPYSSSLTASGGNPPYQSWAITNGTLPPGLTINTSTGVISGTPT